MKYVFLIFLSFIILNGFGQAEEYTNKRMLNSFTDGNNIVALSGIFIVKNNSKGFSLDQERFIKDGISYTNGITGYINNPDLLWFDFHHTLRGYLFYYTIRPFVEIKYATLVAENGVMLNIGGGGGVSLNKVWLNRIF